MSRTALCQWVFPIVAASFFVLLGDVAGRPAKADQVPVTKITKTLTMDAVGNAHISQTLTMATNSYTLLKSKNPSIRVLLRRSGMGRHWSPFDHIEGKFNDLASTIEAEYIQRGFARVTHGNEWSMFLGLDGTPDLVDIHGTKAIFENVNRVGTEIRRGVRYIICPEGSTQLSWHPNTGMLTYVFEPKVAAGGRAEATFAVDHKDCVMSCLGKVYSNERFTYLWIARSRFDNAGTAVLSDYRVRFRIAGFSAWSEWKRAGKVYPGESVVDPFYPVLDVDKLSGLTASRPATLEIEYQYRRPDGQLVAESDSRRLQVLGLNETLFSGLASSVTLNFAEACEYVPTILTAFTTPGDPVIQELAGRVSGRAQCAATSSNDDAFKFLRTLYAFLAENRLAYQSAPEFVNGPHHGQHIKYGRDVLRNHAGTCADLAVLWASTCEAVGLSPVFVVVPGHCFVEIKLPNGQVTAVETTAIGKADFNKAVETGLNELKESRNGESVVVDVSALRGRGIQSVDLPAVPNGYLASLGYQFDAPAVKTQEAPRRDEPVVTQTKTNESTPSIVGKWNYTGPFANGNLDVAMILQEDGKMALCAYVHNSNGINSELRPIGRWSVEGETLVLVDEKGNNGTMRLPYRLENGQLVVTFTGLNVTVYMSRYN